MKINDTWHDSNNIPENPSEEELMHWHFEHNKNCHCQEIPAKIKAKMLAAGYKFL